MQGIASSVVRCDPLCVVAKIRIGSLSPSNGGGLEGRLHASMVSRASAKTAASGLWKATDADGGSSAGRSEALVAAQALEAASAGGCGLSRAPIGQVRLPDGSQWVIFRPVGRLKMCNPIWLIGLR